MWIAAIAILALRLFALVASVPPHAPLTGDEPTYSDVAQNLLAGNGFARAGHPWVLRPPGWPLTLAAIYATFGSARRTVVLWQGLFDTGTVLAYAWLAGRIFRSRAALVVGFLVTALWPPFLRESRFLQTDPLFTLGAAALTCVFARFAVKPTSPVAFLTGLTAGLAVLVRPTGLLLLAGLTLGWFLRAALPLRRRALGLLLIVVGFLLVLTPWTIRNARVFGRFIPVSTGGGEMFFTGTTPETDGRWKPAVYGDLVRATLDREEQRLGHPLDPVERDQALQRAGIENWKKYPRRSLIITAKRFFRLCFVPLSGENQPLLRLGFLLTLVVLYVLAVPRGVAAFRFREGWPAIPGILLIALVVYIAMTTVFYTNSRYIEPTRGLFIVLASGTIAGFLERGPSARGART